MGRVSQSVEYTAAGALIRYTDAAGDDVTFAILLINLIRITIAIMMLMMTMMLMTR